MALGEFAGARLGEAISPQRDGFSLKNQFTRLSEYSRNTPRHNNHKTEVKQPTYDKKRRTLASLTWNELVQGLNTNNGAPQLKEQTWKLENSGTVKEWGYYETLTRSTKM
ncbi:hypothetical protein DEO72_LG3g2058 [Vigna unguiculata]|uniref:Uncharacterized protein n=1 Tax=Vigna unguiculata TaxID=3917 RepID=A0A4D6LFV9_VIGUN|nr:hypothetical protein DEO72_LG3g2058 [Vigna unguiculata]